MLELVLGTPHVFSLPPATRDALDRALRLRRGGAARGGADAGSSDAADSAGGADGDGGGDGVDGGGRAAAAAAARARLYLLRAMMELCVYPPRPVGRAGSSGGSGSDGSDGSGSSGSGKTAHAEGGGGSAGGAGTPPPLLPWSCSERALLAHIAARDPAGRGLGGALALRLLQRLLHFDPSKRPAAAEALRHAYFTTAGAPPGAVAAAEAGCGALAVGEEGWC